MFAHEIGHAMGMIHDQDHHGGQNGSCNDTGLMTWGLESARENVWSTCSKADFLALFQEIVLSSQWLWCLECMYFEFEF